MMRIRRVLSGFFATLVVGAAAFAAVAQDTTPTPVLDRENSSAAIMNASGEQIGWANFETRGEKVLVTVSLKGLTPGFHGLHLHGMANCDDSGGGPFTGAGGHITPESKHPNHAGDFPSVLANDDGEAYLSFLTDRFIVAQLMDFDGTAIMVHAGPDNYANIPERYGTPDEDTLKTGDSGDRIACGIIGEGLMGPDTTILGTTEPDMSPTAQATVTN